MLSRMNLSLTMFQRTRTKCMVKRLICRCLTDVPSSHILQRNSNHRITRQLANESGGNLLRPDIRSQLKGFQGGSVTLAYGGEDKSVAVITVSNEDRRNAFSGSMCVQLHDIVTNLSHWKAGKGIILRGSGGMFCSGADLTMARQIADPYNGEKFSYFMQTTMTKLRLLPLVSLALLQGQVLGGGAELMIACDYKLATENTQIGFIQGHMGIVPGWAGATHLVNQLGYHRALDVLLTGRLIKTDEAKSLELITDIIDSQDEVTEENLLQSGLSFLAARLSHLPSEVVQGMKTAALNAATLPYQESVTAERKIFKTLWGSEANIQAMSKNMKHK